MMDDTYRCCGALVDSSHKPGCGVGYRSLVGEARDAGQGGSSLEDWWMETAKADLLAMGPKVEEYTASDLVLMGQFLEHWLGIPAGSGTEAACVFYLLGKVARAVAAYKEGRLPSIDTLHDSTVYSMMMRRIREVGGWPG